jgi:hypothetical protein
MERYKAASFDADATKYMSSDASYARSTRPFRDAAVDGRFGFLRHPGCRDKFSMTKELGAGAIRAAFLFYPPPYILPDP